jgi:SRSO17 transposase
VTISQPDTAAVASIWEIADRAARVDGQVRAVLCGVMAQERSTDVALDYVRALCPGVKANCWTLAEAAGHEGWGRMHRLLGSYRWDWKDLRAALAALAAAWIGDDPGDLIGPGVAVDETAHLKRGDATAAVAPQHAGCTGTVDNCVTTVFSAYVTARGQAWVDHDVYLPQRWADDDTRRAAAGIPDTLTFQTKPQLATEQVKRLAASGLPVGWAAFDEVYGRSEQLRKTVAGLGRAYVAIIPCTYQVGLPSGTTTTAAQTLTEARFERRSCGNGTTGPRYSDWAMIATVIDGQYLLIRRLLSRPDQLTFYLCWAPPDRPATMTYVITIAGRRWPVEETFTTGKDVFGWDQTQARTWNAINRHTALAALAQLRAAAIRGAITATGTHPAADQNARPAASDPTSDTYSDEQVRDLLDNIPVGDAPVPARGGLPRPPGLAPIRLSIAETTRLSRLATQLTTRMITAAQAAFAVAWSLRRRRHQAIARWHHYSTRLAAIADTG